MKIIVSKSFRNFVQMRIFIGTFTNRPFPIYSKYGEVWLHTRLASREKGTGTNGGDKSFGVIQRVEAPKETEQRRRFEKRVNQSASSSEFYLPVFAPFPSR